MNIISSITVGRVLTPEESTLRDSAVANAVAAGTTNGTLATSVDGNGPGIRIWTTTDSANAFISLYDSFTPAITSAQVLTV